MTPDAIITLPERRAGIYHLVRDSRVLYVGKSQNLLSRIGNHEWQRYEEVRLYFCAEAELDDLEEAHITRLQPPLNCEGVTRPYRRWPHKCTRRLINAVDMLQRARREVRELQEKDAARPLIETSRTASAQGRDGPLQHVDGETHTNPQGPEAGAP